MVLLWFGKVAPMSFRSKSHAGIWPSDFFKKYYDFVYSVAQSIASLKSNWSSFIFGKTLR